VNVPMSSITRPRTPVPTVPQRRERRKVPRPGGGRGPERQREFVRRRLALAGASVCVLIAVVAAVLLSGSGPVPPATGAARVVPADVLGYVHLSTDTGRPAVRDGEALARKFPDLPLVYAAAISRLTAIVGGSSSVDFATGIRPWLGKEAAFALLDTQGSSAPSLIVLDVSNLARARRFVGDAGAAPVAVVDGVRILGYRSGTELAFVGHYLVVGPDGAVRGAIAAGTGRARSLAGDPAYQHAAAGEPAGRVLDVYLPAAGLRRVLEPRGGVVGAIVGLLDRPALEGTTLSLSPVSRGADVHIHSALRSGAVGRSGGTGSSRSRPISFAPTLQSVLPAGSTLMLDVAGLDRAGPQLLRAFATAGVAANVAPLLARLGTALAGQGVTARKVVSSIFSGETAVALSPGPTPSLLIVARTSHQAATQSALAGLEAPLAALFPAPASGPGEIPGLADQQVGGVTVHELGLGPGLQIDYAVSGGLAVVSTSVRAIDEVVSRSRALADDNTYKSVLANQPGQLSSVLFADFSQLLSLGEQTGLTSGARMRELLPDLSKIRAIGLSSTSGQSDTTTELHVEIP
jgi:Protein of unknown function (DUF3352)